MEYNSSSEIVFCRLDQREDEAYKDSPPQPWVKSISAPRRLAQILLAALCLMLLCGLISLGVHYAKKNNRTDYLEDQVRSLSASLSSAEQRLADAGKNDRTDYLEAQVRNLSASLSSAEQRLADAKERDRTDYLEAQVRNLSASLSSAEQRLADAKERDRTDYLEDQVRSLSASLSSAEQRLADAKERDRTDYLEDQVRSLSASLSSAEQRLADARKNDRTDYLEDQVRSLSASLSSAEQRLAAGCIECDSGWRKFEGKCYFFSTEKKNWMQSRDYCISKGAHLVIINSKQEQTFVNPPGYETHWIGLSDRETEGRWMWVDNTPLSTTEKHPWYTRQDGQHEPDNWTGGGDPDGEDCISLDSGYTPRPASCRQ
ncbi:C-type lectin domain family 10 member A-like [Megalops cyprinoides]|uniref:C-type lectin domain family 10 member A-like n=1 Tax=Megalops cyprinoides TaxID=118141 RepID=UPI00186440D7|nr:C-type lectin domain family 10 member A-like [Megalops cyprinoides]